MTSPLRSQPDYGERDRMIEYRQVVRDCPECASLMAKRNWTAIRESALKEAMRRRKR
jgi:hypothetical protein